MPFFPLKCNFHDRIRQSAESNAGGLGDFTLSQGYTCSKRFGQVFSSGDNIYYMIHNCQDCDDTVTQSEDSGDWEIGCAPFDGTALLRSDPNAVVFSSSNNDNPVDFPVLGGGAYAVEHIMPADYLNAVFKAMKCLNPAGEIRDYAGANIPDGWMLADGSELNRDDYPELFSAIGTVWNLPTDTDVTKFRIPDLCGNVTVGAGDCLNENTHPNAPNHDHFLGFYGGSEYNEIGAEHMPDEMQIKFRMLCEQTDHFYYQVNGNGPISIPPYSTAANLIELTEFNHDQTNFYTGPFQALAGTQADQKIRKPFGFTLNSYVDFFDEVDGPNNPDRIYQSTSTVSYESLDICGERLACIEGANNEPQSNMQPFAAVNKIINTGTCFRGQNLT